MKKRTHHLLWPALAVTLLDQISKIILVRAMPVHDSVPVINGFFNLVHVRNRGMAFGMMNRPGGGFVFYFLIAATLGAIVLLLFWFRKLKDEDHRMIPGLSLILGGAIGNLIDRIRLGEVIDFLDFYIGQYHWPAFNVADSAITVGVLWVAINMLFHKPLKT
ncbi:MAG: signal peptidase II [Deltaproteobacteria bacterium]|nr:signal peptidase II [Deltaproteobacteria bacterium]